MKRKVFENEKKVAISNFLVVSVFVDICLQMYALLITEVLEILWKYAS